MARTNTSTGGGGGGVESLNALTGAVTLSAGQNISLGETGNNIEINANFTQSGKYMISGGAVWSGTGLTYDVSIISYFFNGLKSGSQATVTLDPSDPTNNRLDSIVIDEAGTISVITGVPSASPVTPPIPEDQLEVQIVLVEAGSTTPTIQSENIYLDNPTSNWTFSTYTTGAATGSINFAGTNSPKQGTECIEASTDARLGARFVRATSFDAYQYTMLQVWVRFTGTAVATNKSLNVRFENSAGTLVGSNVNLFSFGLSRSILNTWQLVVVPITAFGALPATVKGMKVIMAGGTVGVVRQWDIDYMILTNGSVPFANVPTIAFYKDDVGIASQSGINLIEGTGVTIDAVNNPLYNRVDYTINSSGGGTPAGSDTWIQYNNAGSFGADAGFTRDVATGNTLISSTFGTNTFSLKSDNTLLAFGDGIGLTASTTGGDSGFITFENAGGSIAMINRIAYSSGKSFQVLGVPNKYEISFNESGVGSGKLVIEQSEFALTNFSTINSNTFGIDHTANILTLGDIDSGNGTAITIDDVNEQITISNLPSYDDDTAAGTAGLTAGMIYMTTGSGSAPLNAAGILMIKQ